MNAHKNLTWRMDTHLSKSSRCPSRCPSGPSGSPLSRYWRASSPCPVLSSALTPSIERVCLETREDACSSAIHPPAGRCEISSRRVRSPMHYGRVRVGAIRSGETASHLFADRQCTCGDDGNWEKTHPVACILCPVDVRHWSHRPLPRAFLQPQTWPMEIARPCTRRFMSTQRSRPMQHERSEAKQPPVGRQRARACLLTPVRIRTAVSEFQSPRGATTAREPRSTPYPVNVWRNPIELRGKEANYRLQEARGRAILFVVKSGRGWPHG